MASPIEQPTRGCHVLAMPYPGRGHINPMMCLCKLMSSKNPNILFTFVVNEEWHSFINCYGKPENIRFETIPNTIPSELVRGKDFVGFFEAVSTKMEAPFEQLLDRLELPVNVIIADTYLCWVVRVGNRRNIPVASLWTMPALVFSVFHHFDLLLENGHFPADLSERGEECVDYIPGIPPTGLLDFPTIFDGIFAKPIPWFLEAISMASKAQYLLFTSSYDLEPKTIDALKSEFQFPVLPLGPIIPYFELETKSKLPHYLEWLNSQPKDSVLYISMGSFLPVSSTQMDEMVAGVVDSGVRFLWVSRGAGENSLFKNGYGDKGLVVSWCDQLRVLCHPSVGGFWTHCGWNSTLEGLFAGLPMLTSPIVADQIPNSKKIVKDLKIGWRVNKRLDGKNLVSREEIAKLVQSFMDSENIAVKEMRKNAKEVKEACQATIAKGGLSDTNLDSFIRDISE